jgi:S-adenosylmethionine:tRNA ribosyltransferase-isomerase
MRMSDLDYHLPPTAIALRPADPRDHSRLMVVPRRRGGGGDSAATHRHFYNLPEFLRPGDLLVTNNTRVLPAKLLLKKQTGAAIPGLFVEEKAPGLWEVMLRTRGKVREGDQLAAAGHPYAFALEKRLGEGLWQVRVDPADPAPKVLDTIGAMPIPPYIEKARKEHDAHLQPGTEEPWQEEDRAWYQTVFAAAVAQGSPAAPVNPTPPESRSVAAPTAGLHFTPELLAKVHDMGVEHVHVELNVGLGTFLPVETETLEEHVMHTEHYRVPAATVSALRTARAHGGRIVVVGTTAVRTLESAAGQILDSATPPADLAGTTALKIMPPYRFRLTDALITNFHLPKSTLMALVSAYLQPGDTEDGVPRLKALYAEAVRHGYRFYSYGDAMLIA